VFFGKLDLKSGLSGMKKKQERHRNQIGIARKNVGKYSDIGALRLPMNNWIVSGESLVVRTEAGMRTLHRK